MNLIAFDIGGANLKLADGRGLAISRPFPLWREPDALAEQLAEMLAAAGSSGTVVATMTGELADCYRSKAEGVRRIVEALVEAAGKRLVAFYGTDGRLVGPDEAIAEPLRVAASNWHVLASFAARYLTGANGLLVDIGSTTCDLIPLIDRRPAARGATDPERLACGELVYTGIERSPVCAVVQSLPWRGQPCRVAQELFATTWDAYLTLGLVAEEPDACHTADGRPATRELAHDRLARMVCADRDLFSSADAQSAAKAIYAAQLGLIESAAREVLAREPRIGESLVVSGCGEFLARLLAERLFADRPVISLAERLGPTASAVAPAHALAVLARELLE